MLYYCFFDLAWDGYFILKSLSGGMAEWLKAAVLKTAVLRGTVGSNPTPSAKPNKFSRGEVTERLKVLAC